LSSPSPPIFITTLESEVIFLNICAMCWFYSSVILLWRSGAGHSHTEQVCIVVVLYLWDTFFEFWLGYQPSWEIFRDFPQSFQIIARIVTHLSYDCFLPNSFLFINHLSSCHSVLYNLATDSFVKKKKKKKNPPLV
jgi:hypothetical protein